MAYDIRPAEPHDFRNFGAIESAAASLFAEAGLPEIASHEPTGIEFIEASARAGAVFVATADREAVGFILSAPLDRHLHIYELSVHPGHGKRGLGRRLVDAVCRHAQEKGYSAVTLSTFRDIPWNGPFYASCGFTEIPRQEWTPALLLAHYREEDLGLPVERRCFMRKEVAE
ncbi:MAG: GNAT family N-acetyltransferase [Alphaproteobacteria bacterium]|nr:GNAT family N-acetyltransferase [Alphaproteobacteria bacterium]MDX5416863.1 GNAT family N-acetyltransferase [Alphaproteobacteria bacterium]MDX5494258.1 GNAT family N-acetyltransferase [Alphaproteobacteria bacterium]